MYYKMEPIFNDETITIDQISHWDYSLTLGEIQPRDMPEPLEYVVDTEMGGSYLPATFLSEPVFSNKFIQELIACGIDNIQTYDVNIVNPDTKHRIEGYLAVNIIGKIVCADMNSCESEKLAIKPLNTDGLSIFRLAQSTQIILIHENIVKQLSAEVCRDINFEPVDEI